MTKILNALIESLATYFKQKATIAALMLQITDRDKIITDLVAAHAADDADDAALQAAAQTAKDALGVAKAEFAQITEDNAAAEVEADKLLAAIHADDEIPVSVTPDGPVQTPTENPA